MEEQRVYMHENETKYILTQGSIQKRYALDKDNERKKIKLSEENKK